jgi:hypothetical protein
LTYPTTKAEMAPDTLSERFLYPLHRALPHALSSRAAN